MARRRSRSMVKGKPNYLWINTSGILVLNPGLTVWDAILDAADWSGTVTETQCTLLRLVFSVYAYNGGDGNCAPMAQNCAITLGEAGELSGATSDDMSTVGDWPAFFLQNQRVLRLFRLEWDGEAKDTHVTLNVQFSQLPEPVMNLKSPRRLNGDDQIRVNVGGAYTTQGTSAPAIVWFSRALVRTGLR